MARYKDNHRNIDLEVMSSRGGCGLRIIRGFCGSSFDWRATPYASHELNGLLPAGGPDRPTSAFSCIIPADISRLSPQSGEDSRQDHVAQYVGTVAAGHIKPSCSHSTITHRRQSVDVFAYSFERPQGPTMEEKNDAVEVMHRENIVTYAHDEDERPWYQQPELRKLYLLMPFLFLGSTTLGYDGSLLNGLQTMPAWQSCKQ